MWHPSIHGLSTTFHIRCGIPTHILIEVFALGFLSNVNPIRKRSQISRYSHEDRIKWYQSFWPSSWFSFIFSSFVSYQFRINKTKTKNQFSMCSYYFCLILLSLLYFVSISWYALSLSTLVWDTLSFLYVYSFIFELFNWSCLCPIFSCLVV